MSIGGASVWLIAGPTASGKSGVALALARATGAEIVNADALQLYRDLRVLTARPTGEDEAQAAHHLYGVADAADGWSVGRWLRAALAVLAEIAARGCPAIVVGGTGLYFRALTAGLADIPAVPDAVRAAVQAAYDHEGEDAARARLATVDPPSAARIAAGDRQRLVRALSVAQVSGRPLSAWRAQTRPPLALDAWRGAVLEPPRAALYARCDARLAAMIEAGALEEARALLARDLDPTSPALKAVGLRELGGALSGALSLADAVVSAQRETRRYAKRQTTWFRNQTPDWPRVTTVDAAAQLTDIAQALGMGATRG